MRLSSKLRRAGGGMYIHWCPGCKRRHAIYTEAHYCRPEDPGPRWSFNGDAERPTFNPSVRIQTNEPRSDAEREARVTYTLCHYFIRDGVIDFCSDSAHELAGKSVPLPDLPQPEVMGE
jgi:hypothetical protein